MGTKKSPISLTAPPFSLLQETDKFLLEFPAFAENTIFVLADEKTYNFKNLQVYGHAKAIAHDLAQNGARGSADEIMNASIFMKNSFAQPANYFNNGNMNNVVSINPHASFSGEFSYDDTCVLAFFHETGHLVTPLGMDADLRESSADAYMALRILQTQEDSALELLEHVKALRSQDVFMGRANAVYNTSIVIDKIIHDSKTTSFKSLSPMETAKLASQYAQENAPKPEEFRPADFEWRSYCKEILTALRNPKAHGKIPELLSNTVLASNNYLSFYIGASFIEPFLTAQGANLKGDKLVYVLENGEAKKAEGLYLKNEKVILPDSIRKETHALISERAKHFNLQACIQKLDEDQNGIAVKSGFFGQAQAAAQKVTSSLKAMCKI
jgi:hypothetical protein